MAENNRAYAYRMLRKNIMTLQLQPGCQLSEAELGEQLAMSRTPVHEALMMLKSGSGVDTVLIAEGMAPAVAAYYTACLLYTSRCV